MPVDDIVPPLDRMTLATPRVHPSGGGGVAPDRHEATFEHTLLGHTFAGSHVAADGNCFYHSLSRLLPDYPAPLQLRRTLAHFCSSNLEAIRDAPSIWHKHWPQAPPLQPPSAPEVISNIAKDGAWTFFWDIQLAARCWRVVITVVTPSACHTFHPSEEPQDYLWLLHHFNDPDDPPVTTPCHVSPLKLLERCTPGYPSPVPLR